MTEIMITRLFYDLEKVITFSFVLVSSSLFRLTTVLGALFERENVFRPSSSAEL